jgi:3-oxo-5-alpha-steroid 4-dehydrogenase 1
VSEAAFHAWATWAEFILAGAALAALVFVAAPYGRHGQPGWGPAIPNSLGWVVMELPAVLVFPAVYSLGGSRLEVVPLTLAALWMLHYLYRAFVFPFLVRTRGKRMAVVVVAMGFAFNTLNAYLIARWIDHFGHYQPGWLRDPRFLCGTLLFTVGFALHLWADRVLIGLRRPGEIGYRVPRGGLFEYVTCPNYLGEIVEWSGFALATWSLAGLAFALFTTANLGPRAFSHRRWYRAAFADYPAERKALIPFVI